MKLLMVSLSTNFDHQNTCFSMYKRLEKKYPNTFFLCSNNTKIKLDENDANIILVDCPNNPGLSKSTFNIKKFNKILQTIKHGNFDKIYFESLHTWNILLMVMLKRKHIQFVHSIHDALPHEKNKKAKFIILFNKLILKLADKVVLRSQSSLRIFKDNYNTKNAKLYFVPVWRPCPKYVEHIKSNTYLFFGRMAYYKGIEYVPIIASKFPNLKFNIIGKPVDEISNKIIAQLRKISNCYVNTNYVTQSEMEEYFKSCDFVLLPYIGATQSGVVIDSYLFSKPVIAFDVGAIGEQVVNSVTGFKVEAGNVSEFCNKIIDSNELDNEKYNLMQQEAYKFGVKNYSVESCVSSFISILND